MTQSEAPAERIRRHLVERQRPDAGAAVRRTWAWVRTSPVTTGYLGALLCVRVVLDHVLTPHAAASTEQYLSTNLDNLEHHPLPSLLGSGLIIDTPLTDPFTTGFGGTLITLVAGIAITLAVLGRRFGAARAYTVLAAGHIGATLLVAPVIAQGIAHGWYPASLRTAHDVGISYGAEAVLACATFALIRRPAARVLWAALVLAWPLADVRWTARLPDFTTLGHLTAAAIGFALGLALPLNLTRGRDDRGAPRARP